TRLPWESRPDVSRLLPPSLLVTTRLQRHVCGVDHRRRDFSFGTIREREMHPLTSTFALRIDGRHDGFAPRAAGSFSLRDMRASRTLVVCACSRSPVFGPSLIEQTWKKRDDAGSGDGGPSR